MIPRGSIITLILTVWVTGDPSNKNEPDIILKSIGETIQVDGRLFDEHVP